MFKRYFHAKPLFSLTVIAVFLLSTIALVNCSPKASSPSTSSTGFKATINGSKF